MSNKRCKIWSEFWGKIFMGRRWRSFYRKEVKSLCWLIEKHFCLAVKSKDPTPGLAHMQAMYSITEPNPQPFWKECKYKKVQCEKETVYQFGISKKSMPRGLEIPEIYWRNCLWKVKAKYKSQQERFLNTGAVLVPEKEKEKNLSLHHSSKKVLDSWWCPQAKISLYQLLDLTETGHIRIQFPHNLLKVAPKMLNFH